MGDLFYLIGILLAIAAIGTAIGFGIKTALESTKAFDDASEYTEEEDVPFSYKDAEMPVSSINIVKPELKIKPIKREAVVKEAKPRKPRESRKKDVEK